MSAELPPIYTIGHSNRSLDQFLGLLSRYGIEAVADIRRWPASRHVPWAAGDRLKLELGSRGLGYRHFPALGGYRKPLPESPNGGWRAEGFRGYADYMATKEFRAALPGLQGMARERPTAIMCAEAVPWKCHRSLVADALHVEGWEVWHILGEAPPQLHRPTPFLRVSEGRLIYPAVGEKNPGSSGP